MRNQTNAALSLTLTPGSSKPTSTSCAPARGVLITLPCSDDWGPRLELRQAAIAGAEIQGAPCMKHPSIRALFDHWQERRGGRMMPERAEIEPGAIRRTLADTFILSFEPSMGHPFRLAGTRVCALFGREIKGEAFVHLFAPGARREMGELLAIVAEECIGMVASAREVGESATSLELMLLPLGYQGGSGTARFLGALAPNDPPHWLGSRVVGALTLGTYRFLGHTGAIPVVAQITPQRARPNLVVYDGGQPQRSNNVPLRDA
jgi:hypothetical protein